MFLSIRSFVVDFSNYKRTTLQLHQIKDNDEEQEETETETTEKRNEKLEKEDTEVVKEKKEDLWQSRNYSKLMMSTAKWTDNITQFIFFIARAMLLIWACTLGSFKISQLPGIPPYMFLTRPKTYEKTVGTRKKLFFPRFYACPGQNTGPKKSGRKIL